MGLLIKPTEPGIVGLSLIGRDEGELCRREKSFVADPAVNLTCSLSLSHLNGLLSSLFRFLDGGDCLLIYPDYCADLCFTTARILSELSRLRSPTPLSHLLP